MCFKMVICEKSLNFVKTQWLLLVTLARHFCFTKPISFSPTVRVLINMDLSNHLRLAASSEWQQKGPWPSQISPLWWDMLLTSLAKSMAHQCIRQCSINLTRCQWKSFVVCPHVWARLWGAGDQPCFSTTETETDGPGGLTWGPGLWAGWGWSHREAGQGQLGP